jgi:hypothetical protein
MPENWHPLQQVAASTEHPYGQTSSNATISLPKGQGPTLQGNYNAQLGSNEGNLHYEALDACMFHFIKRIVRDQSYPTY